MIENSYRSLMGMNVHIVRDVITPRIEIPQNFEWCTAEYRDAHNAWLLDRFGVFRTNPVPHDRVLIMNGVMVIRPEHKQLLNILGC